MDPTFIPLQPTAARLGVPAAWLKRQALTNGLPHLRTDDGRLLFHLDLVAEELAARVRSGENFAALAAEYNEDFADGRARAGDLGWIHKRQPNLSPTLAPVFGVEPGTVVGPTPTNFGWLLVMRER